MVQVLEQRFLYSPLEKIIVNLIVPQQPMENDGGADTCTAAHEGPHTTICGCTLKEASA